MQLTGAIIFLSVVAAIGAKDLREKSASYFEESSEPFYQHKLEEPRGMLLYAEGNIVPGVGYSNDTQQVAPQVCFNAKVSSTAGQQALLQLDTAISFSELDTKLGTKVSISGRYGMFSADAKAHYMRSLQDKEYATSLHYYEYATNNVAIDVAGYGEAALTETGKQFYNGGKNPRFGLSCGDHYISSYAQGALLVMSLNIKFSSAYAKQQFDEKVGGEYGNIISAAESVKTAATDSKVGGTVVIQVFQQGGEPSQLSKILSKDGSGDYYALSCSLTAMDNCIKAASGLLDYARHEFSKQFSFEKKVGLTPMGLSFAKFEPIENIGLTAPASLVTAKVKQCRNDLADKLKENQYYQQKLYPFLNNGYPVKLAPVVTKQVKYLTKKANDNVALLMDTHDGAGDCFNYPDRCENIKAELFSKLENILKNDLKIFDSMKYTIDTEGGVFYNTGGQQANSWTVVPFNDPGDLDHVIEMSVTDDKYSFRSVVRNKEKKQYEFSFTGVAVPGGYKGDFCFKRINCTFCFKRKNCEHFWLLEKRESPFFFKPYGGEHSK